MQAPKISVIIPTRLRDESLAVCLKALAPGIQQLDSQLFEIIVTDDGRSDHTKQLIATEFPYVIYLQGIGRGPAANRNNGARHAKFPFLAFLDDDCLPSPQWLSAFAAAIKESIAVYEGKTTCREGVHSPLMEAPVNLEGGNLWSCNLMIRAETFWSVRGFDESFPFAAMEDIALRHTLALAGVQNVFVSDAVVDHPPRASRTDWKLKQLHESQVIFWSKFPQYRRSTFRQMHAFWLLRIRTIRQYPISRQSLRALKSAVIEQIVLISKMPGWLRKYMPPA